MEGPFMSMFESPTKKTKNDQASSAKKNGKQNCTDCGCSSTEKKQALSKTENQPYNFAQPKVVNQEKPGQKTKIIVKCNCGFPNSLFIRGEGINGLSWEHGQKMTNIKSDEWVWETDKPFQKCQFKVLINDMRYEQGDNHTLDCGKSIICSPKF